jgi:hypothetical protein
MKFKTTQQLPLILIIAGCIIFTNSFGQNDSAVYKNITPACPQKQILDVAYDLFKIKSKKEKDSIEVEAGKLYFAVVPGLGYTLQSAITGVIAGNVSFHTSVSDHTNLSTIFTDAEYSFVYNQLFVPFIYNIWLKDNKWNFQGDVRYYKFPSITYGLGSTTTLEKADKINYDYMKCYLSVFRAIGKDLYFGFGENIDKHWQISSSGTNTNFNIYNKNNSATLSSGLYYCLKFDSRRNSNNPQGGFYCNVGYRTNFTFLGSDNNWQSLIIDTRKYIKLKTKRSNIFAFWSYDWFTFGNNVPYLDLPSSSWDTYSNTGRGYIQGRLRGKNFLYLESEYRFQITCNGLFGGVVFANAQTVNTNENRQYQTILPAAGAGLRIKLNKTSKANFAIDYAVGLNGSRGFFFDVSEVF